MFAYDHIALATRSWRHVNKPDHGVDGLILFLFRVLDALYSDVRAFPVRWAHDQPLNMTSGGIHGLYVDLRLRPEELALLRSAIGLAGDAYCISKRLAGLNSTNVAGDVQHLLDQLEHMRHVRNYFAHLDERIGNPDKHGITGAAHTTCGIQYTASAQGTMHLVIIGNTLHFSASDHAAGRAIPFEVNVGREAFAKVLHAARGIYAKVTAHDAHLRDHHLFDYPPADRIYV